LQSGIAGLSDLPRSGIPAKFNAMQWLHRYVLLSKAPQSLSGISFTQQPIDPLQPHIDCQGAQV